MRCSSSPRSHHGASKFRERWLSATLNSRKFAKLILPPCFQRISDPDIRGCKKFVNMKLSCSVLRNNSQTRWHAGWQIANQQPPAPSKNQDRRKRIMDAKYNWIIDNSGIRMAINVAAFGIWLLACAALLSL